VKQTHLSQNNEKNSLKWASLAVERKKNGLPGRWPPSGPPLSLLFHEKMTRAPGTAILSYKVHDVIFLGSLNFHFGTKLLVNSRRAYRKMAIFLPKYSLK
jgi:hypothetical protein